MMEVKPSSEMGIIRYPDIAAPIFGEAQHVFKTASTLMRVIKLDQALPNAEEEGEEFRNSTIEALQAIWNSGREQLSTFQGAEKEEPESSSSLENVKIILIEQLTSLNDEMCIEVTPIYEAEIKAAKNAADLEKCMHRFWKDSKSITISPFNKSHRGVNGPTLLISYPRLSPDLRQVHLQNYVAKWTGWNELCSTRIYKEFAGYLAEQSNGSPFSVPEIAAFDPTSHIHEMTDGSHTLLPDEMAKILEEKFMELVRVAAPDITPKNEQIMLQERVAGSNLFDFAITKYQHLSKEQKKELFIGLGRLAMMDVLMGNLDRFIPVECNQSEVYELSPAESNFGNVMIHWGQGQMESPRIYAIDNGINQELISDPQLSEKYNAFLQEQFADPQMADHWGQTMIRSMGSCARNEGLEGSLYKECKPFLDDLKTIAPSAVSLGISQAFLGLREAIQLHWDCDSCPLKAHLSWAHPELLAAVSERFEILKSARM